MRCVRRLNRVTGCAKAEHIPICTAQRIFGWAWIGQDRSGRSLKRSLLAACMYTACFSIRPTHAPRGLRVCENIASNEKTLYWTQLYSDPEVGHVDITRNFCVSWSNNIMREEHAANQRQQRCSEDVRTGMTYSNFADSISLLKRYYNFHDTAIKHATCKLQQLVK